MPNKQKQKMAQEAKVKHIVCHIRQISRRLEGELIMAWISVHDTVDGPKLRDFYKTLKCSSFEALGILNYLWLWGLENADKDGRILNADKDDIARFLYGKGAGCDIDTKKIVDALLETGWIDKYPEGLYIHDWEVWQEQWYKAIERRENDAKRKRESRRKPAKPSDAPAASDTGTFASEQKEVKGEEERKPEEEPKYTKDFETFWEVYPRKVGKGDAYKKYQARRKDGFSDEELLTAAKNYSDDCKKKKTDLQYIKHAKTFLSETTPFTDFLPKDIVQTSEPETQGEQNPFAKYGGS